MIHAEGAVTIKRPVNEVYNFLLDGNNNKCWRPAVLDISKIADTPEGVGAQYKQVCVKGPGGGHFNADYEIVDAQPEKLIRFKVISGPARPTGTFKMRAEGKTTQLIFLLDYEPRNFVEKLMRGIIQRSMNAEIANLANLKGYLEEHK